MPMDSTLAEGADSAFPFLMPDGVTLYFANNGGNSLGGYDIFMTRRSDDADGRSYMQPQNIGMPYNSPYDDYMLAIDENSGLGWWATDRNRIPDSLTVYVFVPAQMRVNVEVSDPNLARLARLSDISLTRNEGVDYDAMLRQRLPKASPADTEAGSVFSIDIAGKVYTTLADFSNPDAKSAMAEYLAADAALRRPHLQPRWTALEIRRRRPFCRPRYHRGRGRTSPPAKADADSAQLGGANGNKTR